jgi:hypothetical protein
MYEHLLIINPHPSHPCSKEEEKKNKHEKDGHVLKMLWFQKNIFVMPNILSHTPSEHTGTRQTATT